MSTTNNHKLTKLKKELGLKGYELANILGVTNTYISNLENSRYNLSTEQLLKFISKLDCDTELIIKVKKQGKTFEL